MRSGLSFRILVTAVVVVAFLVAEFALVLHAFSAVRVASAHEERADRSVIAASRVEKLVLDMETGTRGYVITQDERFLQPFHAGQKALPGATRQLRALVPGPRSARIAGGSLAYLRAYAEPEIALVSLDPKAASTRLSTGEGKRRVDAIRRTIDPLIRAQEALAVREHDAVVRQQRNGVLIAAVGIGVTIALFALVAAYFIRIAVFPLRRMAAATGEVAAGRTVEVSERAPGEMGQLAAAFNEMSRSLARTRSSLAEQNLELERLANLLRAVLDATLDGILLSDRSGSVQLANRPMIALAQELGMTMGEDVVDNLLSVADRMADPATYRATMERLRDSPDEETSDEFELAATGRVFQGFTAPVHDLQGGFVGRIWTLREVTRQRELDRLKDEFVATVSHELRTPLTSMIGFLEMVRDGEAGELTEEQDRFLAIVYRSSERLQRLVGDLLFVARLDASGLQLQLGEVALDEVLRESVDQFAALARSRGLELTVDAPSLPPVHADRDRIGQVLGNLLSNAVKFTPAGGRVAARAFVEGERAVVEVEDTGIGIPEAERERLFERFFRSSNATEQAIPGTGLGLVIARAIADAHGGRLGVRSALGSGTCFHFELPLTGAGAS